MDHPGVEQLKTELKQRDDFFAFVAHELRNPLHTLGIQLASIRRTLTTGDADMLDRVRKAQLTLARYTERVTLLLDMAQQDVEAFSIHPADVDVAELLSRLTRQFADEAQYHSVHLRYVGPAELYWHTDATAIEHIVGNLLSNAFKYAAASEIRLQLEPAGDHAIKIAVVDDGCGIPAEQQAQIFDKFQRGRQIPGAGGFGLGLWIVSRLTDALRGTIQLESTQATGSRFTLNLISLP